MKISIVTPVRNARALIRDTACSVVHQHGRCYSFDLEYIVCDGDSSDGTLDEIADMGSYAGVDYRVYSAPDSSMYEALANGLSKATGDVIAYINAGDLYHHCALDVVAKIFTSHKVQWITGMHIVQSIQGTVTHAAVPFRYIPRLIDCGFYGRVLPFIQQESTFWTRDLNRKIDFAELAKLKYAGDAFLWKTFAKHAPLHVVEAYLGGFSKHDGQLSENIDAYFEEQLSIARKPNIIDLATVAAEAFLWHMPGKIRRLVDNSHIKYDHSAREWH